MPLIDGSGATTGQVPSSILRRAAEK